MTQKKKEKIN